jgi:hypothetical protein
MMVEASCIYEKKTIMSHSDLSFPDSIGESTTFCLCFIGVAIWNEEEPWIPRSKPATHLMRGRGMTDLDGFGLFLGMTKPRLSENTNLKIFDGI